MKTLPNKLSDMITLAFNDAKVIVKHPAYILDMGVWHKFRNETGKCHVCLAGSVIANTLRADSRDFLTPEALSKDVQIKLEALNDFRSCCLFSAISSFYGFKIAEHHSDNINKIYSKYEEHPDLDSDETDEETLNAFFNHPMIVEFRQYLTDNEL